MPSLNFTQQSLILASGLGRVQEKLEAASARISSGNRINRPSDDVAAIGSAAKLDAQQARIDGVKVNVQNGVSRMQVTAGQLNIISNVVLRMNEIQALNANATQDAASGALYQVEFKQLQEQLRSMIGGTTAEIGGVADVSEPTGTFAGVRLFGPGPADTLTIGLQSDEKMDLPVLNLATGAIGALISQDGSGEYLMNLNSAGASTIMGDALTQATDSLAKVGAAQSRMEFSLNIAETFSANNEAALSIIRDADVAADSTILARMQILTESHSAMLAQARDASAKLLPLLSRN